MNQLSKAIAIAAQAHLNDVDKGGNAYILHPLRLMSQMQSDAEKMTAVLHDVAEDHLHEGWTFDRLLAEGIPQVVIDALKCVTKTHEDEDYTNFIRRAAANPIAKKVKIADLEDNMNMLRFKELSEKDIERLKKYHVHWNMLRTGI